MLSLHLLLTSPVFVLWTDELLLLLLQALEKFEKKGSYTNQTGAVRAGVFSVYEWSKFGAEKVLQKNPPIWLLQK